LNDTFELLSVARYMRMGMATIPKLSTPRQMDLGIFNSPASAWLFSARLAARAYNSLSSGATASMTARRGTRRGEPARAPLRLRFPPQSTR
jgi:hypothetical protein